MVLVEREIVPWERMRESAERLIVNSREMTGEIVMVVFVCG